MASIPFQGWQWNYSINCVKSTYIHTYHSRFILEGVAEVSQLLAKRNTADMTGGKPIAVLLQSISGVRAINPLVAFYDIHGEKREVLFFYFIPDTPRDKSNNLIGVIDRAR
jgi:hypothetical protein